MDANEIINLLIEEIEQLSGEVANLKQANAELRNQLGYKNVQV